MMSLLAMSFGDRFCFSISGGEAFFPVWASGCQLSAMTIANSLMGGCGLSHEHVEDGCKSTYEISGQKTRQNCGYDACIGKK